MADENKVYINQGNIKQNQHSTLIITSITILVGN